jgi:hypothetical protein
VYRRNKAPPQRRGLPKGDKTQGEITMGLSNIQFIKIDETKKVGPYVVAKVRYPVWLNRGSLLSDSFPRTLVFMPKDPAKEIKISEYLEYKDLPEKYRDLSEFPTAEFGGHKITNLEDWNDTGDPDTNCSNYEKFVTPEDIEKYLKEHTCGWW